MSFSDWPVRWNALQQACKSRNATGRWAKGIGQPPRFEIAPPATERQIEALEAKLGCPIPSSFRKILMQYSSALCIEWALPKGTVRPEVLRPIWAGECRWDLSSLIKLQDTYRKWLGIFTDPLDYDDGPWQNKFAVLEIGTGDMLGIDLTSADDQPVVYLSHEGDDSVHGYRLGNDFEDYIDRLSLLGCVGSEDWQLKPFVSGPSSLLETDGANARLWRDWFGLRLPG
jgi:hypothetical protein